MLVQDKIVSILQDELNLIKEPETRNKILYEHSLEGLLNRNSLAWKQQYFRTTVQNQLLKEFVADWGADKFVVLKGMSFDEYEVYETRGDRFTADIDLLVFNLEEISELLSKKNFVLVSNHKWKGNDYKKIYSKETAGIEVVVELHTRLFFHTEFNEFRFMTSKEGFLVLAPEDLLVHLYGHLAFQHTFLKLHWLIDIYLMKNKMHFDWSRVKYLAEKLELQNSLKMTDNFLEMLFEGKTFQGFPESYIYCKKFLFSPEQNRIRYYLIKQMTKDKLGTNFRYNFLWLLQKGWKK